MRDSTEARRCDECGTEYYLGHDDYCADCAPGHDEGARYGATYAGDGYNDEVRDVLTVELAEWVTDLPGAVSALLGAVPRGAE